MIFYRVVCVVFIALGLFIVINPLKVINTIRVMFILDELDKDDFRVDFYRIRAIIGIIIISLFLLRSFVH